MMSVFVMLFLTIVTKGCALHTPYDVNFTSKNLMTFLTWKPATGSNNETLYQVEYKLRCEYSQWTRKKECWNISMAQCDLTKDIINRRNMICGHVRAVVHGRESGWVPAKMSIPHFDITIDPPRFHLVPETNSMQVHIDPYFENITEVERMEYHIHFKQKNGPKLPIVRTESPVYRIKDLFPGTEYCISVSTKIWISSTQKDYESAQKETCGFTKSDQRQQLLIVRMSVGLIMPLLLISMLLLLIWAFKSIYRPPATLPLNLVFSVEERKTLQRKAYVDLKQYDDDCDSMDGNPRNRAQSKAKSNLYIKLPQRTIQSEQSNVNLSHEPLMEFFTPPPLQHGVHYPTFPPLHQVQAYAPQVSSPTFPIDESYGLVNPGPGLIDLPDFSRASLDSILALGTEPPYSFNTKHSELVYANSLPPRPVYTNLEHLQSVDTISNHSKLVYTISEDPEPACTISEQSKLVYMNSEGPRIVNVDLTLPSQVSTSFEHQASSYQQQCSDLVYANTKHPKPVDTH